jgi:hypothetical protein
MWVGAHMHMQALTYFSLPFVIESFKPQRSVVLASLPPPPTALRSLGTVLTTVLVYDALFFCCHWVLHHVPILYRYDRFSLM